MIRLTAYITLALLIALSAAWISSNPGEILITWQSWEIRFSLAVMALLILIYTVMIFAAIWILKKLNIFAYLADPKRLAAKRERGEKDLSEAWSAFALEDYKDAIKFGLRAKSTLGENPSVLRLLASSTQKMGNEKNPYYEQLQANDENAGWVANIELDHLIDQKSWSDAIQLIDKLLVRYPANKRLLRLNFKLNAKQDNWRKSRTALQRAIKEKGAFTSAEQKHYSAVIDYCLSLEQKAAGNKAESLSLLKSALKSDASFAPAALSAARLYIEQDDKKSAEKILASIWKLAPNDELADMLLELYPLENSGDTHRRIKKIAHSAPSYPESLHMLAKAAIDAEQWPDARGALNDVINADMTSQKTFRLLALLERKQKNDQKASEELLQKAETSKPDNHWSCSACHKSTAHYLPLCQNCGEFDKINWTPA